MISCAMKTASVFSIGTALRILIGFIGSQDSFIPALITAFETGVKIRARVWYGQSSISRRSLYFIGVSG